MMMAERHREHTKVLAKFINWFGEEKRNRTVAALIAAAALVVSAATYFRGEKPAGATSTAGGVASQPSVPAQQIDQKGMVINQSTSGANSPANVAIGITAPPQPSSAASQP